VCVPLSAPLFLNLPPPTPHPPPPQMKPQVQLMLNATWQYMLDQVESALSGLPAWLSDLIATEGLDVALDVLQDLTKPFTGAYFYDELRGLADGAGVDYATLCRIHLIGELTQGDCSMVGANGAATAGGKMMALRALDWDTDGPFKDFPAVIVYHPSQDGHAFANVGFLGWIGALTGMSSAQMSIHEIGVSFPDTTYFGSESFVGTPFVFLLRDILQFDATYQDTVARIQGANRTCDLILGVGDGKGEGAFRAFAYSASQLEVFDADNLQPWNNSATTWHPRIQDVVYYGMDWLCPAYNRVLARQLNAFYGDLSPAVLISNVTAIVQTGDVHLAVYDLTDQQLFVSFMAGVNSSVQVPQMAYDRQFTQLDMKAQFAEPPPVFLAATAA
jgi:isopenicillin-N N-acyltransferase-like protein